MNLFFNVYLHVQNQLIERQITFFFHKIYPEIPKKKRSKTLKREREREREREESIIKRNNWREEDNHTHIGQKNKTIISFS